MGVFFGVAKLFKYLLGVLEIPDIFWGVKDRCWARAYVCMKISEYPLGHCLNRLNYIFSVLRK